jgi:hypothetical protein
MKRGDEALSFIVMTFSWNLTLHQHYFFKRGSSLIALSPLPLKEIITLYIIAVTF